MHTKMKKWIITALAAIMMLGGTFSIPVQAKAPAKEKVEYEGYDKVEVEFYGNVQWKNPGITVKDSNGKQYAVAIVKRDNDEIKFRIKGF